MNKSIRTVGGGTSVSDSALTGLGDIEVAARYALWTKVNFGARRVQEFAVSGGSALPTGNHNAKDSEGNLIDPSQRVALDLGVDGRYAWTDRAVDADGTVTSRVENTGGTLLSLAPGVYVKALRELWLFARGQVPVYKHLFGEQDVKPSFTVGVQYQIF